MALLLAYDGAVEGAPDIDLGRFHHSPVDGGLRLTLDKVGLSVGSCGLSVGVSVISVIFSFLSVFLSFFFVFLRFLIFLFHSPVKGGLIQGESVCGYL